MFAVVFVFSNSGLNDTNNVNSQLAYSFFQPCTYWFGRNIVHHFSIVTCGITTKLASNLVLLITCNNPLKHQHTIHEGFVYWKSSFDSDYCILVITHQQQSPLTIQMLEQEYKNETFKPLSCISWGAGREYRSRGFKSLRGNIINNFLIILKWNYGVV